MGINNFNCGFDDETNDVFIIFEDGEIMYFDEVPVIISDITKTFMETFRCEKKEKEKEENSTLLKL